MATVRLLVQPLDLDLGTSDAVARLGHRDRLTAWSGSWAGGSTIITCDPTRVVRADEERFDVLDDLPEVAGVTPPDAVGGGWFGYLGFPGTRSNATPQRLPRFNFGYYPDLLRHDGIGWHYEALVTDAFTETDARRRIAELTRDLGRAQDSASVSAVLTGYPDKTNYVVAVERCTQAIRRGDIYQANICTQFELQLEAPAYDVWGRLVDQLAPARASLVIDHAGTAISASPELFLRRHGREVLTAPIKGTRPRSPGDHEAEVLRGSSKDRAENIMIVDLMRNDLSRVCRVGSVEIPELLTVEPHPGVWHLVSYVRGELPDDVPDGELLRATFPPGSVTGAPKIRAIEVIQDLERRPRGLYTGALGFASPIAGLELSVAIRTFELHDGRAILGVGGGVTTDSTPHEEWQECLTKAAPLLGVLGVTTRREPPSDALKIREGDGIFETVLIVDGVVRELPLHLARLRRSFWECYRVPLDVDADAEVRRTAAPYAGHHRARIVATPVDPSRLRIEVQPCDPPIPLDRQPGLRLQVRRTPALAPHKFVDRDALNDAEIGLGPHEAVVFADNDDVVLEGSRSNIFVVRDGRICTPPLDGRILPGVCRQVVLNYADDIGVPTAIALISLDELAASDGAFLTNSIRGVQWVRRACGAEWAEPHALARLIATRC